MIINGIECKTQEEAVLQVLKTGRPLNQERAYDEIGTQRLGAIIFNLRNKGYDISTNHSTGKNRFGNTTTYCNYHLSMTLKQIQDLENE